jgi:hypothetical protein
MSRKLKGDLKTSFRVSSKNRPDLAVSEATAFDQRAVCLPLLLELRQRAGVHHGPAGLKLMDMNVHQVAASSAKRFNRLEMSLRTPAIPLISLVRGK